MRPFDFFQIQNNLKQNLNIQKIIERRDPRIDPNSNLESIIQDSKFLKLKMCYCIICRVCTFFEISSKIVKKNFGRHCKRNVPESTLIHHFL
jgi:hypothetical protein